MISDYFICPSILGTASFWYISRIMDTFQVLFLPDFLGFKTLVKIRIPRVVSLHQTRLGRISQAVSDCECYMLRIPRILLPTSMAGTFHFRGRLLSVLLPAQDPHHVRRDVLDSIHPFDYTFVTPSICYGNYRQ